MFEDKNEIYHLILLATAATVVLIVIIIGFIYTSYKRKVSYAKEILNAKIEVQENTLQHISREIHDNIGQKLSVVRIYVNNLELQEKELQSKENLVNISNLLGDAINDLRNTANALNAEKLATLSLIDSLKMEAQQLNQMNVQKCKLTILGNEQHKLNKQQELLVFRICQEFIHNSVKHSQCNQITIDLHNSAKQLSLFLHDDGTGFNYTEQLRNGTGNGLRNIASRAKALGANIFIDKHLKGANLKLILPFQNSGHE
jgi:signal transduction histidine kinase